MKMRQFKVLDILFIISCVLIIGANGISRMESAREQPCFEVRDPVPVDLEWASSIKTMYYSMLSRWELYQASRDLLGEEFETTPEGKLYYDSCIYFKFHPDGFSAHGFNGRTRKYKVNLLSPNMEKFEFAPEKGTGYAARGYATKTDNQTYIFTVVCSSEGEMAWALETVHPHLPRETMEMLMEHAVSLGFKREYFTELRYDQCNLEGNASSSASSLLYSSWMNFLVLYGIVVLFME